MRAPMGATQTRPRTGARRAETGSAHGALAWAVSTFQRHNATQPVAGGVRTGRPPGAPGRPPRQRAARQPGDSQPVSPPAPAERQLLTTGLEVAAEQRLAVRVLERRRHAAPAALGPLLLSGHWWNFEAPWAAAALSAGRRGAGGTQSRGSRPCAHCRTGSAVGACVCGVRRGVEVVRDAVRRRLVGASEMRCEGRAMAPCQPADPLAAERLEPSWSSRIRMA